MTLQRQMPQDGDMGSLNQTIRDAGWYKWFMLSVLLLIAIFNSIDRSIITILQIPLQKEFDFSDTQVGAITGLAFGISYTALTLPIAIVADRTSRKVVLAVAVVFWSVMTACCGLASSFISLFCFRLGVGGGEAAGIPASHALIADYFPPHQRGTALGLFGLAIPIGKVLGIGIVGGIIYYVGWRHVFVLVGIIGALLGPLAFFTFGPSKKTARKVGIEDGLKIGKSLLLLWQIRAFRYLALAGASKAFAMYTILYWDAPFYSRVHHLPLAQTAGYMAVMGGVGGAAGIFLAGVASDRLSRRDSRWYAWLPMIAGMAAVGAGLVQYLCSNLWLSLAAGTITLCMIQAHLAPVVAAIQSLVPVKMRATASAVLSLLSSVLGLSLGPMLNGIISDYLISHYGLKSTSLQYSMSIILVFALIGSALYYVASRHIKQDLRNFGGDSLPR
ncbi:sugar phosphate permease [Paraburkholderia sp. BL27I4N3]|nr:sugar phosphate permease [Paraburkholderia sp. BL27I4N3]